MLPFDGSSAWAQPSGNEGFCSGNGIKKLAAIRAREKGVEWNGETSAREIFARANDGDAFCKEIVRETAERFAGVVSLLVDLFNPEIIVAGGVFMRNYETFMTYMQPVLERECLPFSLDVCKILPAKLTENVGDYSALAIAQWRSGDR